MDRRVFLLLLQVVFLFGCGKGPADVPDPTCLEDLFGYRVAVSSGDSYDHLISEYPEIIPVRVGSGEVLVTVQKGKADYGLLDKENHELPFAGHIITVFNDIVFD